MKGGIGGDLSEIVIEFWKAGVTSEPRPAGVSRNRRGEDFRSRSRALL